ncbi:MAG: tRNA (adenosine(37)-N6)-threonylcarbamoyltransferase complex dimerization subunit type 1 TsaB [Phycisphaerae bacterium]|nr:tRNA (adenosine(37)-N6)-threonylcarbamoyltransferase complex dimerization subunit type 1 TsaB [Phycisphaerae bacterium]
MPTVMAEPVLLAIETASLWGSVALARGVNVIAARELSADRRHTIELLPTLQALLEQHDLRPRDIEILAYSTGPGSFTGLRIAATVARMLQSAVGCGVVAVPTLEVIARNALAHPNKPARLVAILDARRAQVFGAVFERAGDDELREIIPAGIFAPVEWLAKIEQPFSILGDGVKYHRQACESSGGEILDESYWIPKAEHVARIGWRMASAGRFCPSAEILPNYLRPPECEEVYEQRRASARARRGE